LPSAETKRPKRHRSAKIDTTEDLLDEWLTPKNNPVMQGLVSFLNVQPTQPAPTSNDTTTVSPGDSNIPGRAIQRDLLDTRTGDIETASPGDNKCGEYAKDDLEYAPRKSVFSEITNSTGDKEMLSPGDNSVGLQKTVDLGVAPPIFVSDEPLLSRATGVAVREQQLQVRALTRAEDGHSANEQRTYLALWNAGNPVLGKPFRRNTIGHAGLAKMLKVDKRQTKRWIPALIQKLTIEIEIESSYATKTTYRVFERDEIHARRVRAGYTSFIKNRGGVELLKAASHVGGDNDLPSPGDTDDRMGGDNKLRNTSSSGGTVSPGPGDTVSPEGGDTVSPPYKEVHSKDLFKEDSSSEVHVILERLFTLGIATDDDFAYKLIRQSRAVCQDSTIAEILHFTEVKAQYRGIQKSLTGFLLTAVPACLTGESFRLYRQAEIARAAAERQSWIEMRSDAERTLNCRDNREKWEIDNAESALQWLHEHQPWVFDPSA
jgi:hypothetical protein